jgi:hypothetical protein
MIEKKEVKKVWERWKEKPIKKDISLEEKQDTVNYLIKKLPKPKKKKTTKKEPWRPPKIDENVLAKIKLCFSVGMNDEQTAYFCWISYDTLNRYQNKNPQFCNEKQVLKESITMQSRINIWKSIKSWNIEDSKWWLSKRDPEFKNWENIVWIKTWDTEVIVKLPNI